jgi:hypothetical protein
VVVRVCPVAEDESFARMFFVCATPWVPDDVSGTAVAGAGAVTVGVYVEFAYWPRESCTWYFNAGGVP